MTIQKLLRLLSLTILSSTGICAYSQADSAGVSLCGPLNPPGQYGPFDFRTDKSKLPIVVDNHFPLYVEKLIRGKTSTTPGGDIAFTLRAIPNHPNALMAMMLLGEKEKSDQPVGSTFTVECWFERALRFQPDDYIVRMIYISFLTKHNRKMEAMQQLKSMEVIAKDNAFTQYNVGLLYFDLQEYDKARDYAHKAMALGLNLPDLREKLQRAGKWHE